MIMAAWTLDQDLKCSTWSDSKNKSGRDTRNEGKISCYAGDALKVAFHFDPDLRIRFVEKRTRLRIRMRIWPKIEIVFWYFLHDFWLVFDKARSGSASLKWNGCTRIRIRNTANYKGWYCDININLYIQAMVEDRRTGSYG